MLLLLCCHCCALSLSLQLYRSIVNFVADNLAGGPLGVMLHDTMFRWDGSLDPCAVLAASQRT